MASPHSLPDARTGSWLWLVSRLSFVLFIAAVVGLLWLSHRSDREEERATLISDMLWLEQGLHFQLTHNEELLGQFGAERGPSDRVFNARARTLIDSQTGLRQVTISDPMGKVLRALPAAPIVESNGELIALSRSLAKPVYGSPYKLGDNEWWFDVYLPIPHGSDIAGFVIGRYSLTRILNESVPWWLAERYRIVVVDADGKALASRSKVEAPPNAVSYQLAFEPPGQGLLLQATPYRSPTPLVGRLLSAALVLLAMIVLWTLWALRRHAHRSLVAEQALREEHAFRKAMGDSLQTGLRARDLNGRIIYANPAFCEMVGWSAEELGGMHPPMPYWVDEEIEATRALHDRILAGEGPEKGFEIHLKRRSGEIFPVLIHEAPLIDADGRHTGWMSSVIDISERKRAEELARQQQERLQATARLVTMGEMASSLAHELNQPLAAIASYSAGCLAQLNSGNPDIRGMEQALGKTAEQAKRAGRIIRRIYEFARRAEPKSEPCNLDSLIDETMTLVDGELRRSNIQLSRGKALPGAVIEGDRILLGQVLLNLIRNAIDAVVNVAPDRRHIDVSTTETEGAIELRISDWGCGIPAEAAPRLFEPFFTTKPEGMGMGLNICRSIIEAHRGRLWYEPNADGGSIFRVLLPMGTT
jgi:two-component system, LuxR family, sensor histidine kinase DctS